MKHPKLYSLEGITAEKFQNQEQAQGAANPKTKCHYPNLHSPPLKLLWKLIGEAARRLHHSDARLPKARRIARMNAAHL